MQIIIWGMGKIFEKYISEININEVVCFVDRNKSTEQYLGKKVIEPQQIKEVVYDFIVVFSNKFFEEIANDLIMNLGVQPGKILLWNYYLGREFWDNGKIKEVLCKYCEQEKVETILDMGGFLENQQVYLFDTGIEVTVACEEDMFVSARYIRKNRLGGCERNKYDLIILDEEKNVVIAEVLKYTNVVLFLVWLKEVNDFGVKEKCNYTIINYCGYLFGIIHNRCKDVNIYEVTHKKFVPIQEKGYTPLMAGNFNKHSKEYIGDDSGDNISIYNAQINELTALYWIWKNSKEEIIGLNHYRRFFESPFNSYCMLQYGEVQMLICEYDLIVAKPVYFFRETVMENLEKHAFSEGVFEAAYKAFCSVISELDETNKEAFKKVFNGHLIYPCNMFITTRKIMNEYCEWLFPIVFKMLEKIEFKSEWDTYSKRVVGFFSERFFTVWLIQQKYSVKELPIILVGNDGPFGK